jgi:hypothetical protein
MSSLFFREGSSEISLEGQEHPLEDSFQLEPVQTNRSMGSPKTETK